MFVRSNFEYKSQKTSQKNVYFIVLLIAKELTANRNDSQLCCFYKIF
jgi:hypothetical protein